MTVRKDSRNEHVEEALEKMSELVEMVMEEAEVGKSVKNYRPALRVVSFFQSHLRIFEKAVILMSFFCLQFELSQPFYDTVAKNKNNKNTLGATADSSEADTPEESTDKGDDGEAAASEPEATG